jgi:hypothetical protein
LNVERRTLKGLRLGEKTGTTNVTKDTNGEGDAER